MAAYHAKKRLGQHFLESPAIIHQIVELIDAHPDIPVIEIGPGRGALTLPLAESGVRILAIEFDRDMVGYLEKLLREFDNVEIVNRDFLSFRPGSKVLPLFSLVGNLPYNITAPVINWCITYHGRIKRAVFMVQKELAHRIVAEPKTKGWSPLAIFTQLYFDVRHCFNVSPDSFKPPPKVTSSVISLVPRERPQGVNMVKLEKVIRAAFGHRRKLLINNLVPDVIPSRGIAEDVYAELALSGSCRAEELPTDQFLKLTDKLIARNIL